MAEIICDSETNRALVGRIARLDKAASGNAWYLRLRNYYSSPLVDTMIDNIIRIRPPRYQPHDATYQQHDATYQQHDATYQQHDATGLYPENIEQVKVIVTICEQIDKEASAHE